MAESQLGDAFQFTHSPGSVHVFMKFQLKFELSVGWMKIAVCWIEKIRELFPGNRDTRDLNPRN
jgi:hypothetical protein